MILQLTMPTMTTPKAMVAIVIWHSSNYEIHKICGTKIQLRTHESGNYVNKYNQKCIMYHDKSKVWQKLKEEKGIDEWRWLCWSLGMDKSFHPTCYNGCNYLSMLGLKLIHVSKRGHWYLLSYQICGSTEYQLKMLSLLNNDFIPLVNQCCSVLCEGWVGLNHTGILDIGFTWQSISLSVRIDRRNNFLVRDGLPAKPIPWCSRIIYIYIYISNGLCLSTLPQRVLNTHMRGWLL